MMTPRGIRSPWCYPGRRYGIFGAVQTARHDQCPGHSTGLFGRGWVCICPTCDHAAPNETASVEHPSRREAPDAAGEVVVGAASPATPWGIMEAGLIQLDYECTVAHPRAEALVDAGEWSATDVMVEWTASLYRVARRLGEACDDYEVQFRADRP